MNNKTITKFVHQIIQTAFGLIVIVLMSNCLIDNPIQAQSEKELKVMTFNIRYGTANDGKDSWEFRKNKVVGVIKNFGPDIFGLQEALRFQIDELLKQMPDYAYVGFGRDDGKTAGEHSSIFYSKERFQVDSTQTFWFSETPDVVASKSWGNNITRIATWVRLHDRLSGKTFYVFNVHFDHESQTSRQKSAELLVKKISEKSLPIILTGDFNCADYNPAIKTILSSGLIDTYRKLHTKQLNEGTFNSFKGVTSGDKIDFIFVSKDFKIISSEIVRTSYNGAFPSDHFPVTAVISFQK